MVLILFCEGCFGLLKVGQRWGLSLSPCPLWPMGLLMLEMLMNHFRQELLEWIELPKKTTQG